MRSLSITRSVGTQFATLAVGVLFNAIVLTTPTAFAYSSGGCPTAAFRPSPFYPVGRNPRSVTVGDFNNDGAYDLVAANAGGNSVSLLINDGTGAFADPKTFAVGSFPLSVVNGDFNNDGKQDLVTGNWSSFDISILLGDGAAGFGQLTAFRLNAPVGSIATADFNGDKDLDLAVIAGSVVILLGNGLGGFREQSRFFAGPDAGGMAIGDFNGDTFQDIAINVFNRNLPGFNLAVTLGNGTGSFSPPTTFLAIAGSTIARDFTGDGKADLVVANGSASVSILVSDGKGGFNSPVNFAAGSGSRGVTSSDFDGDGNTDLAVVTDNGIGVLLGNGKGQFSSPTSFAGFPGGLAVGDFNRDNRSDLVAVHSQSDNLSLLFGDGSGGFAFSTGGYDANSVVAGDFNSDNKLDLAAATINGVAVLLGDGTGYFGTSRFFPAGRGLLSVAVGDFNGDRKSDLIAGLSGVGTAGTYHISILLGDGKGGFGSATLFAVSSNPDALAVGDLNRDGISDVVVQQYSTISVLLGTGTGGLGAVTTYKVPQATNPHPIAIADLNGDSKIDLAVATNIGIMILLNDGSGKFGTPVTLSPIGIQSIALGDVNHDGKTDLLGVDSSRGIIYVLTGDGKGSFGEPRSLEVGPFPNDATIEDFNDDGWVDLATQSTESLSEENRLVFKSYIVVLLGNGTGAFSNLAKFPVGANPRRMVAGDFNGDNRTDLIVPNGRLLSVLLNKCTVGQTFERTAYFPHIAVGGGYSTVFSLVNTGGTTASARLTFKDRRGGALLAEFLDPAVLPHLVSQVGRIESLGSSLIVNLPPGGTRFISTAAADILKTGWAALEVTGGFLGGVATFQVKEGKLLKATAGVIAAPPVEYATIPVGNDDNQGRFTGFAVANFNDQDLNLKLILLDESGAVIETMSPPDLNPLPPQNQSARFLHEYFPSVLKFTGSVVLVGPAGKKFVAIALIQNQERLTAIPVIPEIAPHLLQLR